jgi:hypothetical protein
VEYTFHHVASFADFVGLGRHSLMWLERAETQATNWGGDFGGTAVQNGMNGWCMG